MISIVLCLLVSQQQPRLFPRDVPPGLLPPEPVIQRIHIAGEDTFLTLEIMDEPLKPDDEDAEPPPPQPDVRRVRPRLDLKNAVLARDNFDRWLFGRSLDADSARRDLEHRLSQRVALVEAEFLRLPLTNAERDKLRLAGRGDLKHFFDRVEDKRRAFEEARKRFATGHKALLELAPLQQEFRDGPFVDGSLFAKALRKIKDGRGEQ